MVRTILKVTLYLEKSLNLVKVLEKYLISLVGHEKSLIFSNLFTCYRFSDKFC